MLVLLDRAFAHAGDMDTACSLVMTANAPAGGAPPVHAPRSGQWVVTDDPFEAADDADVVSTDVWVSMGDESEARRRRRDLAAYVVTANLMRHASPNAVFMHCLPAHRGEEVMADVIDGPRSIVFRQAANRLPTEQALLWALCTGNWPQPAGG